MAYSYLVLPKMHSAPSNGHRNYDCGNSQRQRMMVHRKMIAAGALACIATMGAASAACAQQRNAPQQPRQYTAMVVMTPNGPATCSTWIQWRSPGAHPTDKAAIEYWSEGYLSGLAAGSHHDVIGQFRHEDLAAWLTRYCTANPETPLPLAINALGHAMLAHPGGPL
jgi:hypothetical protein